jgi:glycosyltransferase involved in cell wall biosynthesis
MRKVIHITEDLSPSGGGVTAALKELATHLASHGLAQEIVAAAPRAEPPDPIAVPVAHAPLARWGRPWRHSPALPGLLRARAAESAECVFHLHGVWMAPQWMGARMARRLRVPSVLTPHNMLGPWFWRDGHLRRAKKTAYWHLLARRELRRVTAIHALTQAERRDLERYFPDQRIDVIPNGIDLRGVAEGLAAAGPSPEPGARYVLFLGRLHPVKGLELLIDAFARVHARAPAGAVLVVVGAPDSPAYGRALEDRARAHGGVPVRFVGQVPASERWRFLKHAWVVCAPSYSEGMSMAALEAMASAAPVITSHNAGLPDVPEGGGTLVTTDVAALAAALGEALAWSDEERRARGAAARTLVERRYSWDVVARQYLAFYENLWRGGVS